MRGWHAFQAIDILVSTNLRNYFIKNFVDRPFVTALNFINSVNKIDLIKMLTNQGYHFKNTCFTGFFLKLHNGQIEFQLTQNIVLQTNPDVKLNNELLRVVN